MLLRETPGRQHMCMHDLLLFLLRIVCQMADIWMKFEILFKHIYKAGACLMHFLHILHLYSKSNRKLAIYHPMCYFSHLKGPVFLQRKEVATSNYRIVVSLAWSLCVPKISLLWSSLPFFLNLVIILTNICLKNRSK